MSTAPAIADQVRSASEQFALRFGRRPKFAAVAPGRVNLIGEHTDYNDGFVLPMAIERQTVIVADRVNGPVARVASTAQPDAVAEFAVDGLLQPGAPRWANYVKGVIAGCLATGLDPGPFDALVDSTVPLGGGLSSSAALEVATATLVEALANRRLDPVAKALLCQQAEHQFAGMPCGIMDQFISVLGRAGHAMLLDCRTRVPRMVPLADASVSVLIANTNVKHELTGGEYAQRRAQCEQAAKVLGVKSLRDASAGQLLAARDRLEPLALRRARHVVSEIARTTKAADAMSAGDWAQAGQLMFESHESLREDFEVSCDELDLLVNLAREFAPKRGVYGARMTGGGFGGCTVTLLATDAVKAVSRHMYDRYKGQTGIEPSIFATKPAAGAQVISL
jgi:galactokinase